MTSGGEGALPEPGPPDLPSPEQAQDAPDPDSALDRSGRLKKAPTAFRTISEVADDLHVPQHVLRFWETRFPQVKPLKRGGGRRYYRPDDVVLLRRISDLLYIQGYTIKGVQRLLVEGDGTLAGDLPPPDAADRDDDAPVGAPAGGLRPTVASAAVTIPAAPDAAHDMRLLRESLHEILTGLEAVRRRLPP